MFFFALFRVRGIHLLDSMEDGTEMVAPDPFLGLSTSAQEDSDASDRYGMVLRKELHSSSIAPPISTAPLEELEGNVVLFCTHLSINF